MKIFIIGIFLLFLFSPVAGLPFHDEIGKTRCLDCHVTLPFNPDKLTFHEDTVDVCRQCHNNFHGKADLGHPLGVVPSMNIPRDMPLDEKGKLTCITCHSYHTGDKSSGGINSHLLRRPEGMKFCYSCHRKF